MALERRGRNNQEKVLEIGNKIIIEKKYELPPPEQRRYNLAIIKMGITGYWRSFFNK